MKYCVHYDKNFRHLAAVDEFILEYHGEVSRVPLLEMMEKVKPGQRVLLDMSAFNDSQVSDEIQYVTAATSIYDNITIILHSNLAEADNLLAALFEKDIPYFFNIRVDTVDEFIYFRDKGASDIYVVNGLGFLLKNLKSISEGMRIRVFANVAQTASPEKNAGITAFFIRPEDVKCYEDYVDVIEFFGPTNRASVLYEIYAIYHTWAGKLNDLILRLDCEVQNSLITTATFGVHRVGCEKKCQYNRCYVCTRAADLAKTIVERAEQLNETTEENS